MNTEEAEIILGVAKPPKALARLVKKREYLPAFADPRMELKQLVKMHSKYTRDATRIMAMQADKTNKATGAKIPCLLPDDIQAEYRIMVDRVIQPKINVLKGQMKSALETIPIYNIWLKDVYGVASVSASYICALIQTSEYWFAVDNNSPVKRIMSVEDARVQDKKTKRNQGYRIFASSLEHAEAQASRRGLRVASDSFAMKSSAIRRFCGLSVTNGHADRRTAGVVSAYSADMKTALYLMFVSMRKNLKKIPQYKDKTRPSSSPFGSTTKYYDIHLNNKARAISAGQTKGFAEAYGRRKALDVFVEDYYIISRAVEGLPVWPSYYSAKLGYAHGGKIEVNAPKLLSVDEALALIGYVGGTKLTAPTHEEEIVVLEGDNSIQVELDEEPVVDDELE